MGALPGAKQVISKALDRFEGEEGVRVMLMPARTTAAGLTLTRASRIILLEPAPDPAIPQQACPPSPFLGAPPPLCLRALLCWRTPNPKP